MTKRFIVTICLSRTVSETNGDFTRKSPIFPTPVYFAPPLKGFPWNWISAHEVKKTSDGTTGPNKKFDDIFSRVDTIHQRDGRTDRRDGQTPDDSKDRAYA